MLIFVDYPYYRDVYGGKLDEETFNKVSAKASAYIEKLTLGRASEHADDERLKRCCCELCDSFSAIPDGYKRSEKVGAWSVTYANSDNASELNYARSACKIWLPAEWLYRGIDIK